MAEVEITFKISSDDKSSTWKLVYYNVSKFDPEYCEKLLKDIRKELVFDLTYGIKQWDRAKFFMSRGKNGTN